MFTSSTKCEIRQFQVVVFDSTHLLKTSNFIAVVVQRGKRNVEKSVIHVQSCCSASLNQLLFCRSRRCRRNPPRDLHWQAPWLLRPSLLPCRLVQVTCRIHTTQEKNNGFPFLDILGYLKNTQKIPNLAKWDKSQPGNSQPTREFPTKFPDWDLCHSSKFEIFMGIH